MNRFEWAVNIQRDSYASYVGHYPVLAYFAIAENESIGRERYNFMQASDRFNINSQLEHLQAKYVGTRHADMNRFEWATNIQCDSFASYFGHYPVLAYFAIAKNESIGRERYNFMQASDRFNINSQLEHLQAKYVGAGHFDMNRLKCCCPVVFLRRGKKIEDAGCPYEAELRSFAVLFVKQEFKFLRPQTSVFRPRN